MSSHLYISGVKLHQTVSDETSFVRVCRWVRVRSPQQLGYLCRSGCGRADHRLLWALCLLCLSFCLCAGYISCTADTHQDNLSRSNSVAAGGDIMNTIIHWIFWFICHAVQFSGQCILSISYFWNVNKVMSDSSEFLTSTLCSRWFSTELTGLKKMTEEREKRCLSVAELFQASWCWPFIISWWWPHFKL